jgi:SAM-dependent methyltransferase
MPITRTVVQEEPENNKDSISTGNTSQIDEGVGPCASGANNHADGSQEMVWGPAALAAERQAKREHLDQLAQRRDIWIRRNRYFYGKVKRLLQFVIEPHKRVLNIRCQTGHLMDAVNPSRGVGVEISRKMLEAAKRTYPQYEFVQNDSEDYQASDKFDYILFCDVADTVDLQASLVRLGQACLRHTRLVIYTYNHLWRPILDLADRLGLRMPQSEPNWISEADLQVFLNLSGFECIYVYRTVLLPKWVPIISWFFNQLVARLPGLQQLCMIKVLVARPVPSKLEPRQASVSVIIPCKNERGNIETAVSRIPEMGKHTQIIFCDDKSTDGTAEEVRRMQKCHPERDIKLVAGPGICKADNVWTGFGAASGDVLMILDADLTVMPEELPLFFNALIEGKGELINGTRLVYPMQKMAMNTLNMMGNTFFSKVFSFTLGQPIKDTLCGTKVLWRSDWERMKPLVGLWGTKDRWGDYELLFGAAKLGLRIHDLPIHYQERRYGKTKMVKVFWNGMNMLRMCWAAWRKFKASY